MTNMLRAVRADALFISGISTGADLDRTQADTAIRAAMKRYHTKGCVEQVAYAYGRDMNYAAGRMQWALTQVDALYPAPAPCRCSTSARTRP